jgi:hypothetical protein
MLIMTKEEIIKDTIEWYSVGGRRSLGENGKKCCYHSENGNKCAVGRFILHDKINQVVETCNGGDVDDLASHFGLTISEDEHGFIKSIDNIIEEKAKGHNIGFWNSLQSLHDTNSHWNEDGSINNIGTSYVEKMCKWYDLDINQIFPCKVTEVLNEVN